MNSVEFESKNVDFIETFWHDIDIRTRNILELRLLGFTLGEIGQDLRLSRERVRQLENSGRRLLKSRIFDSFPALAFQLEQLASGTGAVHIGEAQNAALTKCSAGIAVYMQSIGYQQFQAWGRRIPDWWVLDPITIIDSLNGLIDAAPFSGDELHDRCIAAKIPPDFPIYDVLLTQGSGILRDKNGGWIRRLSKSADSAYLWLLGRAEPTAVEEIAFEIGAISARALSEAMRRSHDRFTQVRPEGTWALREWSHLAGTGYRDATEAVIDVLQELGPLTLQQLTAETIRRYPVTPWRVSQCIFSSDVGETVDGRYDLAHRGAMPLAPKEPVQPNYMTESGNLVAVRLHVNSELMRGSGIGVSIWLTWKLGLLTYPSQLEFNACKTITVRRHSSGASISSMRLFAQELGLQVGCSIVVILEKNARTARIRHACSAECPSFPS